MDYPGFIFTYWKKEQQVFRKNLAILKQHPGKDAVHDIRVSIKKLRAALQLYVFISGEPLWEYPLQETEKFFSILGKQRDIEICLALLTAFENETGKKFAELNHYFQSLLVIAHKWTRQAVNVYKKKELGAISLMLKENGLTLTQEELRNKITGVINNNLVNSRIFYKQPHKLRQYLKEIYYWIKIIQEPLQVEIDYEKDLHHILDDFGSWQDHQVFEIKIKHFRKDYLPKLFPEYALLKILEAAVKEKKEKLLKDAFSKTNRLLRKVTEKEKLQEN